VVVESLDNMWMWGCFEEARLYFKVHLKGKRLSSVARARPATKRSCDAALCTSVCDYLDVTDDVFASDVSSNQHF